LDLLADPARITSAVKRLTDAGAVVSAFIDPVEAQVSAAQQQGFKAIELHTGRYADQGHLPDAQALKDLEMAAAWVRERGMLLHAGHGLNYRNVGPIARIPMMRELNIGHAIVSRAIFVGLREAVREMKRIMQDQSTKDS